jgi:hypothetical protein
MTAGDDTPNDPTTVTSPALESSTQPSGTSNCSAAVDEPGIAMQSDVAPTQPGSTVNQSDTENPRPSEVLPQPGVLYPLVTPTTFVAPEVNPGSPPIPDSARPSSPQTDEPQQVILTRPRSKPSTLLLNSPPSLEAASKTNASPPPNLLAGVTDEPTWMKKRQTLNYFRNTFKLGRLPDIILHWYKLEALLGFPETVSVT